MSVFANKLEVSCKAQANKVIASFPDVCMTPPEAPPTPPGVPIPYPNFGLDGDTDKGTGSVKIGGKTVNLKNTSYFTKTTGDEAGAAAKKGVVSSKNTGKAYSQAFSMNVKAEGKNLTRFSDIQTDNHGSPPNSPPWPKIAAIHMPGGEDPCKGNKEAIETNCTPKDKTVEEHCADAGLATGDNKTSASDQTLVVKKGKATLGGKTAAKKLGPEQSRINKQRMKDYGAAQRNDCLKALRCKLVSKDDADNGACCQRQTGHHMVPESGFCAPDGTKLDGCESYDENKALCICAEGASHNKGSHGLMHADMYTEILAKTGDAGSPDLQDLALPKKNNKRPAPIKARAMTYDDMKEKAISSVGKIFPASDCSPACLRAQLDTWHSEEAKIAKNQKLRADPIPGRPPEESERLMRNIAAINAWAKKMAKLAGF
ncbi:PAAR-like domain-containing protein [Sulfitobacter sp. HNIBRBA3233]|uniref:PAAR-like domain-containing protein n=1 Tax=Sulfitobacter marinivivus TaxID=3158558 RepID=UPI0032E0016B